MSANSSTQEVTALRTQHRRHLRCLIKVGGKGVVVKRPDHGAGGTQQRRTPYTHKEGNPSSSISLAVLSLWFSIRIESNVRTRLSVSPALPETLSTSPSRKRRPLVCHLLLAPFPLPGFLQYSLYPNSCSCKPENTTTSKGVVSRTFLVCCSSPSTYPRLRRIGGSSKERNTRKKLHRLSLLILIRFITISRDFESLAESLAYSHGLLFQMPIAH